MKTPRSLLVAGLSLLVSFHAFSQAIKKVKEKAGDNSFSYYVIKPKKEVKGILILLPGAGESPKSVFGKTNLPELLAELGFITAVPKLPYSLFADKPSIDIINKIYESQSRTLSNPCLIVGGFSSGGAVAIGYAEHIMARPGAIQLKAVFAIDPPLDLERLYRSSERLIASACPELIIKERSQIKQYLDETLGGSPFAKGKAYVEHSGFSANEPDGGNARFLKDIAVRLYAELDLEFVKEKYCKVLTYEDINAIDLDGMDKTLKQLGSTNSEYIITKAKGFHSWNIVDAHDCGVWILKNCKP